MQQTDGGWAWAVMAGSMGCNFLNGVMCYFVGVIHTGLLHKYQASVTTTAWVGALYAANMSLTAPIAAAVINRYGCRVCCVVGGLLCFLGFLASAYAPSISWLFVTYGIIAGLGLGLTYAPSIISIGFYFDKLRGVASGLSVGFAAIGILSGSLIAQTLIDHYSVSGAFMIVAALSLHFCFFGGFFRPSQHELSREHPSGEGKLNGSILENKASMLSLALHGIEIRAVSQHSINKSHDLNRLGYGSVTSLLRKIQAARLRQNLENGSLTPSMYSGDIHSSKYRLEKGSNSILVPGSEIVQVECEEVTSKDELEKMHLPVRPDSPGTPGDGGQDSGGGVLCATTPVQTLPGIVLEHVNEDGAVLDQVRHRSISDATETHHGYTNNDLTVGGGEEDGMGSHRLLAHHPPPPHSPCSEDVRSVISRDEVKGRPWKGRRSPTLRTKLLKALDNYVAVLTHKAFMCHCASTLAANIHISGVYLHLPEYALTKGTSSSQAAALFVAVGLSSFLSRLSSGFATMDPKVEPLTLNMGMMGLCGVSTIMFPFLSDTYTGQLVFSGLFGLYTGGLYALISVLTVHFMGISLLPTALGVLAFLLGLGYVAGPPLAALIVDSGGTYQHSFIFLGIMMIVAAFLDMAAVFFMEPREESEEKGDEEMMEVASISRDWLGSSIVISCQDTASAYAQHELGSVMSVRSRFSHEVNT